MTTVPSLFPSLQARNVLWNTNAKAAQRSVRPLLSSQLPFTYPPSLRSTVIHPVLSSTAGNTLLTGAKLLNSFLVNTNKFNF
jgi:hypothetical protein